MLTYLPWFGIYAVALCDSNWFTLIAASGRLSFAPNTQKSALDTIVKSQQLLVSFKLRKRIVLIDSPGCSWQLPVWKPLINGLSQHVASGLELARTPGPPTWPFVEQSAVRRPSSAVGQHVWVSLASTLIIPDSNHAICTWAWASTELALLRPSASMLRSLLWH